MYDPSNTSLWISVTDTGSVSSFTTESAKHLYPSMAVPFLTVYPFVFANDLTSKYLLSSSLLNTALFSAKKTGLFSSMMTSSIPVSPPATFPLYR